MLSQSSLYRLSRLKDYISNVFRIYKVSILVESVTVRIEKKTQNRLKKFGRFGEDDYDSIINRALDALEESNKRR
jgi:hypothetical protein